MSYAEKLVKRYQKVKSDRGVWESHWQDTAKYVLPRKAVYNETRTAGDKLDSHLYDGTAIDACERFASALHTLLTGPQQRWFELSTGDRDLDAKHDNALWLQGVTDTILDVLEGSNFSTEIHEMYLDQGSIGTSHMDIMDDPDDVVAFHTRHLSEVYLMENAQGHIDSFYRCWEWSAERVVERWGKNVSPAVAGKVANAPDEPVKILHYVVPAHRSPLNKSRKKDLVNKAFHSIYIEVATKQILEEKGFYEYPSASPRWLKVSGEVYGRSPGMKARADAKMLNKMSETTISAAEKVVDPPLAVYDDSVVGKVRTFPAAITYVRPGAELPQPILNNANVGLGLEMENQRREAIRRYFFNDILELIQKDRMTATEVSERRSDKMALMGPMIGRLQKEALRPIIARTLGIVARAGLLPPAPEEIKNAGLTVRYSSPLALAQRAAQADSMIMWLNDVAPLAEMGMPVLDNLNADVAAREIASMRAMPAEWLMRTKDVAQIRTDRAELQSAQMNVEMQNKAADTAAKQSQAQ